MPSETLTMVVENILYSVSVKEDENELSFTCQPVSHMIIHYSDGIDWHKEQFLNTITLSNVKKYYITFGLTDQMAQIYMDISPPIPITQPRFYKMHTTDNFPIMACSAKNWFRIYNYDTCDYYIYSDSASPQILPPQEKSIIYTYDTDIIVRKENNYIHLPIRDLTPVEKDNLVPCDLIKKVYTYTRWASINWMPKQDYQWIGTLSLIKENDTSFDCTFTDGNTNFTYPILYVKKMLKHIMYGKITGTFMFEPIVTGSHIRYIPMLIVNKKKREDENTEFVNE